jgi:hypothetical protein
VSRDKSVRRSAQDDDFVGVLKKNIPKLALMAHDQGQQNLCAAVAPRETQVVISAFVRGQFKHFEILLAIWARDGSHCVSKAAKTM